MKQYKTQTNKKNIKKIMYKRTYHLSFNPEEKYISLFTKSR